MKASLNNAEFIQSTEVVKIPYWVCDSDISSAAVVLYGVLYSQGRKRRVDLTRNALADLARVSTRTIDKAIKELIGIGALVVFARANEYGGNSSNFYRLQDGTPAELAHRYSLPNAAWRPIAIESIGLNDPMLASPHASEEEPK
jgi:hypothetical protein